MTRKVIIKRMYLFCRALSLNLLGRIMVCIAQKEFKKEEVKRILVIKLEKIGDLVLSIPILRELKSNFPHSYIAILVNDYSKDIVSADSNINEVLLYKKSIAGLFKLIKKIQDEYFDLVIDLTGNDKEFIPVLISYLSKAKYTVGLNQSGRGFLHTIKVNYDPKDKPLTELMFDIMKPLGIYSNDIIPRIDVSPDARIFADGIFSKFNIKDNDLMIGIHPGGYYPSQCWPEIGFAKVADELIKRYAACVFIISGCVEKPIVFKIVESMRNKPQGIINDITLQQLMGVISHLDLLICNNSGPLHIATALGIPTVSTMGPTLPERWRPRGKNHIVIRKDIACSPCNLGRCRTHECMELITPGDIIAAVEVQLKNLRGGSGDGYSG